MHPTMNMNMQEFWTTIASLMGVLAFFKTLLHTLIPSELHLLLLKLFQRRFNSYCYFEIPDIDSGYGFNTNELYKAVQLYLSSFISSDTSTTNRLSLTRPLYSSTITFGITDNDSLSDVFYGVYVVWEHIVTPRQGGKSEEKRKFTLRINKKDKPRILNDYLDFITEKANEIYRKNRDPLLYTNKGTNQWYPVPFNHPSTFETLAMDLVKKTEIISDLRDFEKGEAFYKRTGRAWKRGYLLYGPPGTGKSSMIAAMANYLHYDIYDLELTEVKTNFDLRSLLMQTHSQSIIVIEDIDCSVNLTNLKKRDLENSGPDTNKSITLSGLLNFTDGLWSCFGSERIFIFTTNHIEKLDPALLRSGRMDMHVFMSYCSFPSLKILLKNYLDCDDGDIEKGVLEDLSAVIDEAEMTPADISEVLIKNKRDKEKAVREVLETSRSKVAKKRAVAEEEEDKRVLDSPKDGDCTTTSGGDVWM